MSGSMELSIAEAQLNFRNIDRKLIEWKLVWAEFPNSPVVEDQKARPSMTIKCRVYLHGYTRLYV